MPTDAPWYALNAERLMFLGGLAAFLLTVYQVRNRDLREKYAVAWLLVGLFLFLCGLFPQGIMLLADRVRLSYPAAVLFIALAAIYLFSFSVSMSLTRQYRRGIRIMQEQAILAHRLRMLERKQ
jgi:hypothetical membrane protein